MPLKAREKSRPGEHYRGRTAHWRPAVRKAKGGRHRKGTRQKHPSFADSAKSGAPEKSKGSSELNRRGHPPGMRDLTSGEMSYIGGGRDGEPPARERRTDEGIGRHGGIVARNRCGDNFHRCPGYSVSTAIRGYARELSDSAGAICRSGPVGVGHRLSAFEAGGTEPRRRAGPSCIQCWGGYLLRVGRCCDPVSGLLVMAGRRSACRYCRRIVFAVSGKEFAPKLAFWCGVDGRPFFALHPPIDG